MSDNYPSATKRDLAATIERLRAELAEAHELDIKQHAAIVRDTLEIAELEAERNALRAEAETLKGELDIAGDAYRAKHYTVTELARINRELLDDRDALRARLQAVTALPERWKSEYAESFSKSESWYLKRDDALSLVNDLANELTAALSESETKK